MTPEDIAEIEERAAHITEYGGATAEEEQLANVDVPALLAEVERLAAELDEARAALDRVRALHSPMGCGDGQVCGTCPDYQGYPCQTIRAIDGSGT